MKKVFLKTTRRLIALLGIWIAIELVVTLVGKKWILSTYVLELASKLVSPEAPYASLVTWMFAVFLMIVLVFIVVRAIKEVEYLEAA